MFFFGTPKPELGLIFDIGSSSVGAALALFEKGSPTRVIYTLREPISFKEKPTPERFFEDMIATLGRVNMTLLNEGFRHLRFTEHGSLSIKHVSYVFSSPWCVSQTKLVSIAPAEPFVFSEALVERIMREQERAFEALTLGSDPKDISDKLSVIERRVIHVSLNGYQVSEPYGKKVRQADISLFMSLAPKTVIDRVSEASLVAYHPRDTKVFSFPLAAFSMVRDSFHDVDDFLFLDLGGEISEISVIKSGLILETASFPVGFRSLVRSVAKAFATTYAEADSLVKLHSAGHCDESVAQKLAPVLEAASKSWATSFHGALSELSTKMSLPRELFVSANSEFVGFFARSIRDEKVSQFGVEGVPFSVTILAIDKLKESVVFAPHARKDISLALAAGFVGRNRINL